MVEQQKTSVVLGLDPGFQKLGVGILTMGGGLVECRNIKLRPDRKLNQGQVDGFVSMNIKRLYGELFSKYDIQHVVIELQIGQYMATQVQMALVCELPNDVMYTVQHSKMKLKHSQVENVQATNQNSNKYNQNKNVGKQLVKQFFPDLDIKTNDECDAILHAKFAVDNMSTIRWLKKQDMTE